MISEGVLARRHPHVHALVGSLLQHLLDLLVGLGHVVLVLPLDVQVQLAAAHLRLLPRLHEHAPQRDRAVGLVLDAVQELLVAGLLAGAQGVVVDLEVVGEEVRALAALLRLEGADQLGHLLHAVVHRVHHLVLGHRLTHRTHCDLQQFLCGDR